MKDILRPIYQERASSNSTLGILLVEKKDSYSNTTDSFDYILLVLTDQRDTTLFVKHYTYQDKKAALYVVSMNQVQEWLLLGSNRRFIEWLHAGKVIFDRNENITKLKEEMRDFPFYGRKLKKGMEFAKLIRRFVDGKSFFEKSHYLDAYNNIVHALHHLARLEIIDHGFYPEVTVWEQVKHIEPQIFKLYEELVTSEESLEKRLELLFLASEFLINSRMEIGSQHFVTALSSRDEAWTIGELLEHPELKYYAVDLSVLLEYLVEKDVVEVVCVETKSKELYHRLYKIS